PSGHAHRAVRFHRLRAEPEPLACPGRRPAARPADGQPDRPRRGAGVRQDCGRGARRRHARGPGAASDFPRQSAQHDDPGAALDAACAGQPDRVVRAQRVRAGRDLGHRLVRPMGRGAGQATGENHHCRADLEERADAGPRQLHQHPDPPLSPAARPPDNGTSMSQKISPLAGKPAPTSILVDVPKLLAAYVDLRPDPSVAAQRVAFGTSGHRGSSFERGFNEWHILAISQAICEYRKGKGIDGPLFIGADTHALSQPALESALEVLAANGVQTMLSSGGEFTPTPAVSHAILVYNKLHNSGGRRSGLADGIVITPSHNPPDNGGFKYNPTNGGPADTDITNWVQQRANALLEGGLKGVKRMPLAQARKAATTHEHDFLNNYVADLAHIIDFDAIRGAGVHMGVDPLGGAGVHYWQ